MQDRRTARSHRFLLRLCILSAAFAAALVVGTVAAQADEQNITPDESAAGTPLPAEPGPADDAEEAPADDAEEAPADDAEEAPADDAAEAPVGGDPIIEDEGDKYPPKQQDQASLTEVAGAAAEALQETVSTTGKVVGAVQQSGSQTVENTVDAISQGTPPEGLPEDLEDTAHSAVAPLLELVPDGTIPGHETPGHDPADGTLPGGVPALPNPVPGIERGPHALTLAHSPASSVDGALTGGNAATSAQLAPAAAAPADGAATTSSDLGGDSPLTQLLGGDHGVVTGGSGAGAADRATPASASYGDHAELVSDPVRTDARPHTAPVARPEFAPD